MKALGYDDVETLVCRDMPDAVAGIGEHLIRVEASGIAALTYMPFWVMTHAAVRLWSLATRLREPLSMAALGTLEWPEYRSLDDGAAAFADILAGRVAAPKIILTP